MLSSVTFPGRMLLVLIASDEAWSASFVSMYDESPSKTLGKSLMLIIV